MFPWSESLLIRLLYSWPQRPRAAGEADGGLVHALQRPRLSRSSPEGGGTGESERLVSSRLLALHFFLHSGKPDGVVNERVEQSN